MKVRVVLSIDIDPEAHDLAFGRGTSAKAVADDVREYVLNMVQQCSLAAECNATATLAR
jgi:hypothetical protein